MILWMNFRLSSNLFLLTVARAGPDCRMAALADRFEGKCKEIKHWGLKQKRNRLKACCSYGAVNIHHSGGEKAQSNECLSLQR